LGLAEIVFGQTYFQASLVDPAERPELAGWRNMGLSTIAWCQDKMKNPITKPGFQRKWNKASSLRAQTPING